MKEKIHFNKNNREYVIKINHDKPFLKLNCLTFNQKYSGGNIRIIEDIEITIKRFVNYDLLKDEKKYTILEIVDPSYNGGPIKFEQEIVGNADYEINEVQFICDFKEGIPDDLEFELSYETYEVLPIKDPWLAFENHLNEGGNSKILFSAPFGVGKTTFLNEFFFDKNEYEMFHLYPVNYSVAQNEDIFQYIKVEILFQLFSKDVDFEKESFSKALTFTEYARNNFDKLILPFLRLIPKVGGSIHDIIKDLNKFKKEYNKFHEGAQINDEKTAEDFLTLYYEKEGSIYEDNVITQIIKYLLEQIKEKNKRPVLIIDDTDRMDPEHIFRILNVFAAHFDTKDKESPTNKFGFEKIIIVCDYNNLRKIFHHKYGSDTDFGGYIDKFFSKSIFQFNNLEAKDSLIDKIFDKVSIQNNLNLQLLLEIIKDLNFCEELSLREIFQIKNNNTKLIKELEYFDSLDKWYLNETGHQQLSYLHELFGTSSLLLQKLRNTHNSTKLDLRLTDFNPHIYLNSLIPLTERKFALINKVFYKIEDTSIEFEFKISQTGIRRHAPSIENDTIKPEGFQMTKKIFYLNLISMVEKYV